MKKIQKFERGKNKIYNLIHLSRKLFKKHNFSFKNRKIIFY